MFGKQYAFHKNTISSVVKTWNVSHTSTQNIKTEENEMLSLIFNLCSKVRGGFKGEPISLDLSPGYISFQGKRGI
jgi:hypothetical protein